LSRWGAYRVYLIYSFASVLFFSIFASYNLIYYAKTIGLNPLELVLVGTLLELTCFICEVPTGIVADVYSRRLSIIVGVLLAGIGFTLEGIVPAFWAVLLSQVIWGLGATFISGASTAWITDEVGEANIGPVLLRGSQWAQVGGLAGVAIATALAVIALNLPLLVGGLAHIVLAVFLMLVMPENHFVPTPREDRTNFQQMAHTFSQGLKVVRARTLLITLLAVSIFWGMASEGYDRLSQKHILDNFTLPTIGSLDPIAWFGIMSIVGGVIGITVTEAVRRRIDTNNPRRLAQSLTVITSLLIGGVLLFAVTGNVFVAFGAGLLVGTLRGLRWPLFHTWINQQIDSRVRATVLSMQAQMDALGQIAGGPAVGYIGLRVGVRAAIITAALLLSPILPLHMRSLRRPPAPELEVEEAAVG
jgi:MFS transporter, DHA3 family, tetracycline resistance protein